MDESGLLAITFKEKLNIKVSKWGTPKKKLFSKKGITYGILSVFGIIVCRLGGCVNPYLSSN
jgi:hypothetical protein